MSSGAGHPFAHRSVASIRLAPSQSQAGSSSSHTPRSPRTISASYGSPSAIRAEDDFVLVEIGSRFVRAGFAGDSLPKVTLPYGPEQQRRTGDFRALQELGPPATDTWAADYEMWRYDLREVDLGLFQDKLDRLLRDAFTRYLLIDSRPRRIGLVLDPAVPVPLLSTILDTLFHNFQAPMVSLMSSPTMSAVAGGVRCALVVDMGWAETVVTSVYEYREVKATRTVRGGRLLLDGLYALLRSILNAGQGEGKERRVLSFDECEDILCRLMWCRASAFKSSQRQSAQLDTVEEQDESEMETANPSGTADIPLRSSLPPSTLQVPFGKLADVCDETYFDLSASPCTFDDHELPVHLLVYHHLLQLPVDVRALCMSRLMITGGCSEILGIKERIFDEVTSIVDRRGWAPVSGKGVDQLRNNPKLRKESVARTSISSAATSESGGDDVDGTRSEPADEEDPIEAKIARNRRLPQQVQGQLRAMHSLGPWAGASLVCQLKMPAMASMDREQWLQHGANGASRPSDVDTKAQQRHMAGTGGLMRSSAGNHVNWTLGIWGSL
ncbi:Actin-like protein [Ophiocordyceps sinensis CO18]|nr:Actin-like protein [Ophiocordyceps sinensis CO18]